MPDPAPAPGGRRLPDADELRRLAEEILRRRTAEGSEPAPVVDDGHLTLAKAVHELRLHEIEHELRHQSLARAHADLQATISLNRALFSACPAALILTDERGTVLEINDAALRLIGRRAPPVGPTLVDGLFAIEDRQVPVRQRRECGLVPHGESPLMTARLAAGARVEVATRLLRDPHRGRLFLHAFTDITDREDRIQELDRARMSAQEGEHAKRILLAMASHELRTPLQAIGTTMEILSAAARDDAERELVAIGQSSLRTLLQEIDGLLDTARLEQGGVTLADEAFQPAEVLASAMETVALARERRPTRIAYELAPGVGAMRGDAARLRQVVVNLLDNACTHTRPGTSVRLRLLPLAASTGRGGFRIEVLDQGPGLDEEVRRHLFSPFVRGIGIPTTPGFGLGLALAKGLVARMGGRIGHLDRPGGGSLFWVEFDLPAAHGFVSRFPPMRIGDCARALWIDEDEEHAASACAVLTAGGCEAHHAASVAVAAARLDRVVGPAVVFVSPQAASLDPAGLDALRAAGHVLVEILSPLEPVGSVGKALGSVLRPATPGRLAVALDRIAQGMGLRTLDDRPSMRDLGWNEGQALIDAMPEHVAILDRFGVIRAVNRRWRDFAVANGSHDPHAFINANYLEACWNACQASDPGAISVTEGLRDVLAGRRDCFSHEYPCHSPQEQRWFILYAATLRSRTGDARGAVITHLNITLRRQQEHDKDRIIGELRQQLTELIGR
jgi:PAS domain S-box-containing protein